MLTRPRIEALVNDPAAITLEAIRDAVVHADPEDAAARAVARLHAGEAVALDEIADVVIGAPSISVLLHLVGATGGDRAAVLVDLLERDRFWVVAPGPDLAIAAAFAAWRLDGRTHQAAIARHLRRLTLHTMSPLANVLATSVIDDMKDKALTAATERTLCQPEPDWTASAVRALGTPIAELVASLPAENEATRSVPGFTVRSAPRPGRNEPCPCGSGKKYKKCHAELDEASAGSPVAGMSWDQFLKDGAATLTTEQIQALPLRDLARVDLARLARGPWAEAVRRFVNLRRWDLAARALEVEVKVEPVDRDDLRAELAGAAISARELEWARAELGKIVDRGAVLPGDLLRIDLLERPPDVLDRLHAAALDVVRSEDRVAAIELAYALLDTIPALGVLIARDVLGVDRRGDSETLLELIEDARDSLGLMPGNPAWERWTLMKAEAEEGEPSAESLDAARLDQEARELRASLEVEAERVAALERQLNRQRAELAAAGRASKPVAESEEAAAERRALRDRLETLQAQIREQNEERAELRRKLAAAPATARPEAARRPPAPAPVEAEPDDADAGESADPPRRALVPRFSRSGEDALADVPAHVAASAVRIVGELASGERGAWRNVKQAQDLEPPLLMARVGIHHRILFRADGAHLDVLDLVTREALMHALRRLRR